MQRSDSQNVDGRSACRDEVQPATRALAIAVIPFLFVAAVILGVWPDQTGRLFAWPIKPSMTAFLLGSAYLGGIYFFSSVVRARQWHRIQVGFLPVTTFASLLGLATLLHWDRFTHDHVSFWAWATLYFVAPFLVPAAWWVNRRQDLRVRDARDPALPRLLRLLLTLAGLLTLAFGLWLFIDPSSLIPHWAWTLSPLTARVVAAIVSMQGVALLGIGSDERWSVASVMVEAELVTTPVISLAALKGRADFDAVGTSAITFAAALGFSWLLLLAWFIAMRRRERALGAAADAGAAVSSSPGRADRQ
jgi:hypothetical protein